ncbi:MAG: cobaltochelatase subunit CobN, partial [Lentisphaeria bacterium]|nr:cobaltochelatase subunit CobN [Lentisphaeria bacterium]
MPADLYQTVTERYGEFPGRTFRTEEGNMELGCIRFGNIILMPQSLPGEGSDESKLIHGAKMAPPHTYIATYLYIRHGFKADAMMHLGTHGSLEFTPWKQAALSSYDWPDVLVGEMPHYYLYIINNIGEAQIAKRRAYATMVSHLTPPFMNAESYGYVTELHEKMHHFETADNAKLKAEYAKSICETVKREHIDRDLKLSAGFAKGKPTTEDLERIENFLHEVTDAKVNRGMYIIGRPYSAAEADETARLMTVDAIADALFKADVKAGKVNEEKRKDKSFYRKNYLERARERAKQALQHPELFRKKPAAAPRRNAGDPRMGASRPGSAPAARPRMGMMGASKEDMEKMLKSGKLPDGRDIPPAMLAAMKQMMGGGSARPPRAGTGMPGMTGRRPAPPKPALAPEEITFKARADLLNSTGAELKAILNAFSGGYLEATSGGDPILNPATVPTGKNLYGIDPERTPTRESYAVGKELAEALIKEKLRTTGKYPKKVGFSLWGGEFIRTQGTNIGEIFHLLGVEPVWDSRGRVQDVRLIPLSRLKRPRIDVIVQTSGQFRGAATSRMRLIDKAVLLAATDPENSEFANYVKSGSLAVMKALTDAGMSPEQARALGHSRIFGGVNGNFGTGVTGMAQNTGSWEDTKVIADLYLNNMGALYTEGHWGEHIPGVFKAALIDTDTVVQSRSSNSWGPLSLDHVYEFTGGLSLAARHVTGKDPGAFFNDLRTPGQAKVQEAGEAAMVEARSTVLNPKYIKEMMKEGAPATGAFTEVFRNTLGWEVMKPDM